MTWVRAFAIILLGVTLSACGDDSSGGNTPGNNNNGQHGFWDAGPSGDGHVWRDAASNLPDAAQTPDAASQVDAASTPDSGGQQGNGKIGDPCTAPSDCEAPTNLQAKCLTDLMGMVQLPGGYCTASCTPPGQNEPDPCAPDGVCYGVQFMGYCLKPCTDDTDCRQDEGYVCTDPMSAGQTVCATELSGGGGGFNP